MKFFLNPESSSYLRSLESEFGESTNAIRVELNRFEKAGMLKTFSEGNRKIFKANSSHPLFEELRNIVVKHTGIDRIIEHVVKNLGDIDRVYLTGDLANGLNSEILDLVFIGNPDRTYLNKLVQKAEGLIDRKIRYLIYSEEEANSKVFHGDKFLLIWSEK